MLCELLSLFYDKLIILYDIRNKRSPYKLKRQADGW